MPASPVTRINREGSTLARAKASSSRPTWWRRPIKRATGDWVCSADRGGVRVGAKSSDGRCRSTSFSSCRSSGDGATPRSSSRRRDRSAYARRASACRPLRYRPRIKLAVSRSRNGYCSRAALTRSTTTACSPNARRVSARSSIAARRRSSSRAIVACAAARSWTSDSAGPRHRSSASARGATARWGSPAAIASRATETRRSNRDASSSSPWTLRR